MISLKSINHSNWISCIELDVASDQRQFVNPNIYSLAEAFVHSGNNKDAEEYYRCIPLAIYHDDEIVGFAMLTYEAETDYDHQPAYEIKTFPCGRAENVYVEWHPDNVASKKLFEAYGFLAFDADEDGAVIAKRGINQ